MKKCSKAICLLCCEEDEIYEIKKEKKCPLHATKPSNVAAPTQAPSDIPKMVPVPAVQQNVPTPTPVPIDASTSLANTTPSSDPAPAQTSSPTAPSFIPDHKKFPSTIAPIETIMQHGENDDDDEKGKIYFDYLCFILEK